MKNIDVQMENVNFQVGQTYVILNFEVEKNSGQYKATHHAFKINFVKEPKIMPHEILGTMYNFTMFDNIVNGSTTLDYVTGTIFEYLRNDNFNMLMSLCCLILVFPRRCYW